MVDLAELARTTLGRNRFMVLGTVDPSGRPRVSPVWFSLVDHVDAFWGRRAFAGQAQGAPSQHGRMYPQPSHRSCDVSQRIIVSQLGQGSVRSATAQA